MTAGGPKSVGLRHNRDFLYLLIGQFISMLGSAFSTVAIPLVAVLTLNATAFQTSLLPVAGSVAWFTISLAAGVWLDRVPRKPVLIASDMLRGLSMLAVPIAFVLHGLSLGLLYIVSFVVGWGSVFFQIGYQSYLPTLVHRDDLVRGNARLAATYTVATAAGPAMAGALIDAFGAFGAPLVVIVDAISFLASAASLVAIRTRETLLRGKDDPKALVQVMLEAWRCVWRTYILRAIAMTNSGYFFAYGLINGIFTVYEVRILHLSPLEIGLIAASAGVGGTVGTLATSSIGKWMSLRRSVRISALCRAFLLIGIPLAVLDKVLALEVLLITQFLVSFAWSVFSVGQLTARQTAVGSGMLSNVTAINTFLTFGMGPIGALAGGLLAQKFGVTSAIVIGVIVSGLTGLLVLQPARPNKVAG